VNDAPAKRQRENFKFATVHDFLVRNEGVAATSTSATELAPLWRRYVPRICCFTVAHDRVVLVDQSVPLASPAVASTYRG